MFKTEKEINAVFILALCGMLIGAFIFQIIYHEEPCPLCLLQRAGMMGVICAGFLNIRFGAHVRYYVIALFSAFIGGSVSVRQILLHIAPGSKPLGTTIFHLSLYTWALLTFIVVMITVFTILLINDLRKNTLGKQEKDLHISKFSHCAVFIAMGVILANIIYTLQQ